MTTEKSLILRSKEKRSGNEIHRTNSQCIVLGQFHGLMRSESSRIKLFFRYMREWDLQTFDKFETKYRMLVSFRELYSLSSLSLTEGYE